MTVEQMLDLFPGEECETIRDAIRKLHANLKFRAERTVVAISGGSDSDVMLDMVCALEPEKNYHEAKMYYVWFNTGLEYTATKQHLDYLESKYGITIERKKAATPVPKGCKDYGLPFLSKQAAAYFGRLQAHGFQWEDEPFDVLYERYPKCKAALRFWCNEWGEDSRMNIDCYRRLKDFMIDHPPTFRISDKCCNGAKKDAAHDYIREINATLNMVGIRRAEGGVRATAYSSCFSEASRRGDIAQFRPLFFFTDEDKERYCQIRGVTHSDLYEKYGFVRTGCACCPFGSRFEDELQTAAELDPGLRQAAINIFGPAYEYTRAYRQYKIRCDELAKRTPGQFCLWDAKEDRPWENETVEEPIPSANSMRGQPASAS